VKDRGKRTDLLIDNETEGGTTKSEAPRTKPSPILYLRARDFLTKNNLSGKEGGNGGKKKNQNSAV